MKKLIFILIVGGLFISCSKEETTASNMMDICVVKYNGTPNSWSYQTCDPSHSKTAECYENISETLCIAYADGDATNSCGENSLFYFGSDYNSCDEYCSYPIIGDCDGTSNYGVCGVEFCCEGIDDQDCRD